MRIITTLITFTIIIYAGFTQAQSGTKSIKQTFVSLSTLDNISYFEVTKEMFASLTKSYDNNPEFKEYISKLQSIRMMQPTGENRNEIGHALYTKFMEQTNLNEFSLLLVNNHQHTKMTLFKKSDKEKNEFLLVGTNMIIHIIGTLEINRLTEFEQVMNVIGEAIDM